MSISELNKTKNLHNESANSIPITQENPYHAIDMELVKKETETPRSLFIAKSKDFECIDIIENSKEHRTDTNEEVDAVILANNSDLKVHVIRPADARRKSTIKKFYDSMIDFGKQQRLERQIRRQKRFPQLPVTTHDDLTKSQDPLQAQGYPLGPGYLHSQGYPQKEDQGDVARLRGGLDYDPEDRASFVVIVLTITSVMLAFTALFVGIVVSSPGLRRFFQSFGLLLFFPAIFALIIVNCIFAYSDCGRKPPCNIICLIVTVFSMTCMAAYASCIYKTNVIFQAILATTIVVSICTMLALTKFDFTSYIIYVIVISITFTVVSLMFFGIRMITGQLMTFVQWILILVCTLIQAVILIVELQMVLGGRAIELDENDYALGAYYLYTSVVNIFIKMLALIGTISDED